MDTLQNLIVALLVPGCAGYAAWKLMPSAARRALAAALLRRGSLPRPIEARLRRAAQATSGCGCDGCDHAPKTPAAKVSGPQPIRFHPRTRE
ncbi:MAG: hypothetical protein KGK18_22005 [Burkholderiales bacterium]|nr:hypothetical protein [Burkholderiales bacterium]